MRRTLFLLPLAMMLAGPLAAQEAVAPGTGAMLRGLDKINATTEDLELSTGETGQVGSLEVTLRDCRYPGKQPGGRRLRLPHHPRHAGGGGHRADLRGLDGGLLAGAECAGPLPL